MRFNPKARVDQSGVERRGRGGGGGGGGGFGGGFGGGGRRLPIPSGGGGKLGIGGVLITVVLLLASQCLGGGVGGLPGTDGGSGTGTGTGTSQGSTDASCQTGADANSDQACAIDLTTTSVQNYWSTALGEQTGTDYQRIKTVQFSGQTSSACGTASSQMGPFYCPNDELVYLDTSFFDQMLTGDLGARGGPFAVAYVVAHEYGHHVEDQLGILQKIRTAQGPTSDSVKVELMADCLAGVWAKNAQSTTDAEGVQIISDLTRDDISRAIDAAQSVGDDRIQQRSGGRVSTEQFTHGSSAQREKWFLRGMDQGTVKGCDTFAAKQL